MDQVKELLFDLLGKANFQDKSYPRKKVRLIYGTSIG